MITGDEVMPLLLEACPSFATVWAEAELENIEEENPGQRLGYLDAGDFIRHLVQLALVHETEEFPAVFAVIERLHIEGDDYVRTLAAIGYLEGMQMRTVTDKGLNPEQVFRPYFGERSELSWQALCRFWAGDPLPLTLGEARDSNPGAPESRFRS